MTRCCCGSLIPASFPTRPSPVHPVKGYAHGPAGSRRVGACPSTSPASAACSRRWATATSTSTGRPGRSSRRAWPGRSRRRCGCRCPIGTDRSRLGRADALVDAARRAFADLVGGEPGGVILGPNMTTTTYGVARPWPRPGRSATRSWSAGSTTTRTCGPGSPPPSGRRDRALGRGGHRDLRAARVAVRRAHHPADPAGRGDRGRNAVGTRPDVRRIAERAHRVGALVYVDGVHATAHGPVDMAGLARTSGPPARTSGVARTCPR